MSPRPRYAGDVVLTATLKVPRCKSHPWYVGAVEPARVVKDGQAGWMFQCDGCARIWYRANELRFTRAEVTGT